MEANMEGILGSIFIDFFWILRAKLGRKIDPRGTKIDVKMEVKFNRFLKASWNAIFSAKRRAKRPRVVPRGLRRGKCGPWGGLWRGS